MFIRHVAVYVRDLASARRFFELYFAARSGPAYHNPTTDFRSYFLSFDGGARLELMTRPTLGDSAPDPSVGPAHLAFGVGSREAVDALTARLAGDGYPTVSGPRTTGDGYYESCVEGPEGLLVEITV